MFKRKGLLALLLVVAFIASSCGSKGLKSSNMGGFGPFKSRIPYTSTVNYFGVVSPQIKPEGKYKGKDAYYLYFWVPAIIDEVGVSMYSPAKKEAEEGDFKHAMFDTEKAKDPTAFFDTYLALEKMSIFSPEKIKDGGAVMGILQTNDDSSEMKKTQVGDHITHFFDMFQILVLL
ncbi:MAG: hypothetical protein ACI86H_002379 [bacterium]|jgi:hypothetical protein